MAKQRFYEQMSIDDAQDATENYEDDHSEQFHGLLFDGLLSYVKNIQFDQIIQNNLLYDTAVYKTKQANSLLWLFTADRKLINGITIYSFRLPNACHPECYKTFDTKSHYLFQSIAQRRHGQAGWYEYIGRQILNQVDRYLNIGRVNQNPHTTKLFINQKEERLDIELNFKSINERITITFQPGYPAC